MNTKIEAVIQRNAENEIAGECSVQYQIKFVYAELHHKLDTYMKPSEVEYIYKVIDGFSNYLTAICVDYEKRFPEIQFAMLYCSQKLTKIPFIHALSNKTLSEVLSTLREDNCKKILHPLMMSFSQCKLPIEYQMFITLFNNLPQTGCVGRLSSKLYKSTAMK